jgi:hypothetical protein
MTIWNIVNPFFLLNKSKNIVVRIHKYKAETTD